MNGCSLTAVKLFTCERKLHPQRAPLRQTQYPMVIGVKTLCEGGTEQGRDVILFKILAGTAALIAPGLISDVTKLSGGSF